MAKIEMSGCAKQQGGKSRKQKQQQGGKSRKQQGGKKTRKVSKGASDWNKKVMEVYRELKKKNPATRLGDAMRECSKRKKRGDL
jgi:hypothetical protein